jgi:hypothetical protein
VESLYKKEKGEYHLGKVNMLASKVEEITERLRRNSMLDKINN